MNWNTRSKLKEQLKDLPSTPGVYLMRDKVGKVLYVGKAKDLKKRVRQYFQAKHRLQEKIQHMVSLIYDLDTIEVKSEVEALILESKYIKEFKPKYNTLLTDDKAFYRIRVNLQRKFPVFQLVRNKQDTKSLYFGPYIHSQGIQKVLKELRKRFGVLLDVRDPKCIEGSDKYRLYDDVRSEIYGHPNELTQQEYQTRVQQACTFLQKETRLWAQEVKAKMQAASGKKHYEEASRLRDVYLALQETYTKVRTFEKDPQKQQLRTSSALKELQQLLDLPGLPNHFECFDISHISGAFLVASLIVFKEGKPSKKDYKHYNIKSFSGNDDYQSMREVVGRRYQRLHNERVRYPDFILIDGGVGQVRAALKALGDMQLPAVPVIGLAKRKETIVFGDGRKSLELPRNTACLQLLQQARDEAHRFANTFNAKKRALKIRESILDECPGLGPVKKALLIKRFKNIQGLKQASMDALQSVDGIGPLLAKKIKKFIFDNL